MDMANEVTQTPVPRSAFSAELAPGHLAYVSSNRWKPIHTSVFPKWRAYCKNPFMLNTEAPYVSRLARGNRVIFIKRDHEKRGEPCTVVDPVRNPSQRSNNQWYDVRFDDRTLVRCHERDLEPVGEKA